MVNTKLVLFFSAVVLLWISHATSKTMLERLGSTFESELEISSNDRFPDNSTRVNVIDTATTVTNLPKSGKINFLHIPKTAGTTMEIISGMHNHTCGLWGSRMVGDKALGRTHPWTTEGYHYWIQKFVMKERNVTSICAEWHTPPTYLSEERRRTLFPVENTFCILRDPLARLISAFYHNYKSPQVKNGTRGYFRGPCFDDSVEHANTLLERELKVIINLDPSWQGCHFLPQTYFLRGFGENKSDPLSCNHVLIMEKNLTKQFNELMTKVNCPIRFPSNTVHKNKNSHICLNDDALYGEKNKHLQNKTFTPIKPKDLNDKVLKLANEFYKNDIEIYHKYASKL